MCNQLGRNHDGNMRIEAVMAVLENEADAEKVLILERIYLKNNGRQADTNKANG